MEVRMKFTHMHTDFRKIDVNTLDALLEGIQVIDFNWRYIFVNETTVKHSKYSSKTDLLGFTMMEKFPGIEKTEMFLTLKKCMNERIREEIENSFEYPDKSQAWFKLIVEPVPEGVFIMSFDISEQKKAELALKESEERYKLFFNQSIDAILLTSPDGSIRDANKAALDMLGYTFDELKRIGRNGIVDTSNPQLNELLAERQRAGYYRGELTFVRKDGKKLIGDVSTTIYELNGEKRTHFIVRDVTEHILQVKAIELRNIFYNQLISSQPVVFYIVDVGGEVKFISPNSEQVTGYSPADFVSDSNLWFNNIHIDDKDKTLALKGESRESDVEYRWKCKNGSWLTFKDHYKSIYQNGNDVMYGTWIDITDLKEKENKILEYTKGLEHLLFVTSHKIRQPVAHLLGINYLLERGNLAPEEMENVIRIYKTSATSLDNFTRELNDYMYNLKLSKK
jgi:PAS domain S-box-containing protein